MSRQFTFDRPDCTAEVDVDADVRAEMLNEGCVLCGAPVDVDTFSRRTGSDTAE